MQIQPWKSYNYMTDWTWSSMYNYRASGYGGLGLTPPVTGASQGTRPKDPVWCAVNTADCATCNACCTTNHPRGSVKYNKCLNRCKLRFGEACGATPTVIPPPTVNTCGIVCTSGQREQCHWECPAGNERYGTPPQPGTVTQYPASTNVILTGSEQSIPITPIDDSGDSGGGILGGLLQYWWIPVGGLIAWKMFK